MRTSQKEQLAISSFLGDMKHARSTLKHLLARAEESPECVKLYLDTLPLETIHADSLLLRLQGIVNHAKSTHVNI